MYLIDVEVYSADKKILIYLLMLVLFAPILTFGYLTLSDADRDYWNILERETPLPNGWISLFLLLYGTPAYILLVLISKAAGFFNIRIVGDAMKYLEQIVSLPLYILGIGFFSAYFAVRRIDMDTEKKKARLATANLIGTVLVLSFYSRSFEFALFAIAALSISLYVLMLSGFAVRHVYKKVLS